MQYGTRWMIVLLIFAGLALTGCTKAAESAASEKPALLEPIEGTDLTA